MQSFLNRETDTFMILLALKRRGNKNTETCIDCLSTRILHTFESFLPMELQNKRPLDPLCTLNLQLSAKMPFSFEMSIRDLFVLLSEIDNWTVHVLFPHQE